MGKRRVIETHVKELERQLGVIWKYGRYETPEGQTISPGKIEYLKQLQGGKAANIGAGGADEPT